MEPFSSLLVKGNRSSATAALGNLFLSFVKGFAAFVTGSGTMYASAMHSLADAVNQGFVFVGSILAEKMPTPRFPNGFGRLIHLFCIGAVIVVSFMAFETIREMGEREGIHGPLRKRTFKDYESYQDSL